MNHQDQIEDKGFQIKLGEWHELQVDAQAVRTAVFVVEQSIPADLEWDVMDVQCLHAVAYDEKGRAIGTGRLLPDGHIGRMAVVSIARGEGIGAAILRALIEQARHRGKILVQLNAQISAEAFYRREGFVREGELFLEAGIEHVHMSKML